MKKKQPFRTFEDVCTDLKSNSATAWTTGSVALSRKLIDVLFNMSPGKHRRAAIVRLLQADVLIRVDCKYCVQIKNDRDMQKLLKNNTIEIDTRRVWWNCTQKYVRLKRISLHS